MATLYCDAGLTGGLNNGSSWENAWRGRSSLQTALDNCADGDVIRIAAGVYDKAIASNKRVSIYGEPGSIIDANKTNSCFYANAETTDMTRWSYIHGVILCNGYTGGNGGGAHSVIAESCLFINCHCRWGGGAISKGSALNCTFIGCSCGDPYGTGTGGSSIVYSYNKVVGCIFWNNWIPENYNIVSSTIGDSPETSHNCVYHTIYGKSGSEQISNSIGAGSDTIKKDPLFVDAENGNYHISKTSPCRYGGINTHLQKDSDLTGTKWETPPAIGCYEYAIRNDFHIPTKTHPLGRTIIESLNKIRPIAYLESTGTQWIDTGIIPMLNDTAELTVETKTGANHSFGCTGSSWRTNAFALYNWQFWIGNGATSSIINPNGPATFKIEGKSIYKNGEQLASFPDATGEPFRTIYIFAINDYNVSPHNRGKIAISRYTHYRNGVKILDLVPVRIGSVGYMQDTISGKLFSNQGEGQFLLGEDQ